MTNTNQLAQIKQYAKIIPKPIDAKKRNLK